MIHKFPVLRMEGDEKKPDRDMIRVLCAMGIPMGLQYSITAIGSVILQAAVNSLGSMAVAAVSTGSKISMFFCTPFDALGGTMATWAGQNVGAKKLDRVREGVRKASLMGFAYSGSGLCGAVLLRPVSGPAFRGFIGNGADPADLHLPDLQQYVLYSPDPGECGAVRHPGHGFSTFAILAGVCEMAARAFVGFCLVPVFGFLPACFASPLAWICADLFLVPAFGQCLKKLKRTFGE